MGSAETQAKYEKNLKKKQPSFLDLIFCNECGETFNSKKEEKHHICGNPSKFILDNSDVLYYSSEEDDSDLDDSDLGDSFEIIIGDKPDNEHLKEIDTKNLKTSQKKALINDIIDGVIEAITSDLKLIWHPPKENPSNFISSDHDYSGSTKNSSNSGIFDPNYSGNDEILSNYVTDDSGITEILSSSGTDDHNYSGNSLSSSFQNISPKLEENRLQFKDSDVKCPKCLKIYSDSDYLNLHIKTFHENLKPIVTCSIPKIKSSKIQPLKLKITKKSPKKCQ